jgi:hypothetical protein
MIAQVLFKAALVLALLLIVLPSPDSRRWIGGR